MAFFAEYNGKRHLDLLDRLQSMGCHVVNDLELGNRLGHYRK